MPPARTGHEFIVVVTGKNEDGDWVYFVHCPCGYDDQAYCREDAYELRAEHRKSKPVKIKPRKTQKGTMHRGPQRATSVTPKKTKPKRRKVY